MSRPEIIKLLKKNNPKLNQSEIESIIDIFTECIRKALSEHQNVEIRGFGTFFIKRIKEKYNFKNLRHSIQYNVPEKNKVRFRASKKLKRLINEKN